MKSLIEEASSIAKAVEKGWTRAGKPHSFTVKVFETPEKNFIGITTKYAKVGIFFDEKQIVSTTVPTKKEKEREVAAQSQRTPKRTETREPREPRAQQQPTTPPQQRTKQRELTPKHPRNNNEQPQQQAKQPRQLATPVTQVPVHNQQPTEEQRPQLPVWPTEAVSVAQNWLKECLQLIGLPNVEFTMQAHKNNLTINFDAPLVGNELKETLLYKNLSYLVMAALRTQFKSDLKHLKLLLIRE